MKGWTSFGWQGFRVEVPTDWELVGIPKEHDPDQGYLRLDDATHPRLEIKWRAHPQPQFDIQKSLDEYLKGVRKTYGSNKGELHIARDVTLISPKNVGFHAHREMMSFSWRGQLHAYGVLFKCSRCRRVAMVQVLGKRSEEAFKSLSVHVLQSLQCHPPGKTTLWTAYGLGVEVPRSFRLDKLQLLNGYILFSFQEGARQLVVERYGLAESLLRGSSLEAWFRRAYAKSLRGLAFLIEPKEDGLLVDGRTARLLDRLDRFDTGVGRLWDKAFRRRRMVAFLWHSPSENRIYVVRAMGKVGVSETMNAVVHSIREMGHD